MNERKSREEKMSLIQQKLEEGVKQIYTSEKYKQYIKAMSKFPNYSVNNCILIASQYPKASLVCGYHKWQKDFNRTVNKGQRGIMILAPIKGMALVEEEIFDEKGYLQRDSDGNPETKLVKKEYQTFRPVYVFDISQTSGDPVPSLAEKLEGCVESFETIKSVLVETSPVPVSFEMIEGGANGYYSPSEGRIVIDEHLPQQQMIKTMIHEIAHATLGHGSKEDKWDRSTKEVQAESVAFWVSQLLDMDTSDYSFGYISGWSRDKEASDLKENLGIIKETAEKIALFIEEGLKKAKGEDKEKAETTSENPAPHARRGRGR
ncbi:MAG: ImmA/IrrE family metallo-endopeptidase [Lachnospiraceae bacterium]|nr:ImmA/IrrE family metallo-endopeptidase [Lachnospiraceae bacterium]